VRIIYQHINRVNGKSYVGFTPITIDPNLVIENEDNHAQRLMSARWKSHCRSSNCGSNLVFHCAIRKHGEDAFDHRILEKCTTLEEVRLREQYWIAELHTVVNEHGYNMTLGGDGVRGKGVWHHTEKAKKAISEGNKDKIRSQETRNRIRDSVKRIMTPESISLISERTKAALAIPANRARVEANNYAKRRKRIQQLTLSGEFVALFSSATEASRETGVNKGNLCACARGLFEQAGGFVWHYECISATHAQHGVGNTLSKIPTKSNN